MNEVCQMLKNLYLDPRHGVMSVAKKGNIVQALAIVIVASLLATFDSYLTAAHPGTFLSISLISLMVVGFVALWAFGTLVCYVFAKFGGGQGDFVKLLTVTGYAMAMVYVVCLLDILFGAIHVPAIVAGVINIMLCFWIMFVLTVAVEKLTQLPFKKSVCIVLIAMVGLPAIFSLIV